MFYVYGLRPELIEPTFIWPCTFLTAALLKVIGEKGQFCTLVFLADEADAGDS